MNELKEPMIKILLRIPDDLQEKINNILKESRKIFGIKENSRDFIPKTIPINIRVFNKNKENPYLIIGIPREDKIFKLEYSGEKAPAHFDLIENKLLIGYRKHTWVYVCLVDLEEIPASLCTHTLGRTWPGTPLK